MRVSVPEFYLNHFKFRLEGTTGAFSRFQIDHVSDSLSYSYGSAHMEITGYRYKIYCSRGVDRYFHLDVGNQ